MPFNLPLINEFLHHVINWITCLIDWQLLSYRANWVTGNTWGAKHTQNSPQSWNIAPLLEGAPSHCRNIQRGGAGGNCGGGWGRGRTPGRGPKNRVQGGDEGGRTEAESQRARGMQRICGAPESRGGATANEDPGGAIFWAIEQRITSEVEPNPSDQVREPATVSITREQAVEGLSA